jgi:amino acid adenylation domain-containing protein/thioester reductase-like protein
VGAEVMVGICLERTINTVIGLLGILKAGGSYIPLDPAYPQERLAYMVEDSQLPILLTQQSLLGICHNSWVNTNQIPQTKPIIVSIDSDWEKIAQCSQENPDSTVNPRNLAYTIYTSGSTGKPKGVQIEHQSVVNFLNSMIQEPGITANDRLLAVTTISFDIAALEIYLPLTVGASVIIVSQEISTDGVKLSEQIEETKATIIQGTPATWQMLLTSGLQGNKQLKIICGGEALTQKLASQLWEKVGSLWNMYGPTETTIWSTIYQVTSSTEKIPIGKPIANTEIYILDQHLRSLTDSLTPVPFGEIGELCIGGDGLARGYLNQPELTQQKFVPNGLSNKPESRLYRTGDLVRYLPDGNIEYIGRIDNQVKLRGFRIEVGEIETLLNQHFLVKEAVVNAREENNGEKCLVAYIIPNQETQNTIISDTEAEAHRSQTEQWQKIWNDAYSQSDAEEDPTFNISGWNNSYTGLPVPPAEVREWVEHTVKRILSLKPSRVLEIGCGTGMLLFRIAPHCEYYCGTDITEASVNYIEEQLNNQGQDWSKVSLYQTSADHLELVNNQAFDAVVINSVIQYFPSINYLVQVLENLVNKVDSGGFIFVGDVRSLPLLETFHTSVQLYQSPATLSTKQLKQRIQKRLNQEQGLVIDPNFFLALKQHFPQITDVEIVIKRGRYHNELVRFRYDVILRVGTPETNIEHPWLDWQQGSFTLEKLRQFLAELNPQILVIRNIPNARIFADVKAQEILAHKDCPDTVAQLRELVEKDTQNVVEPEDIWALSEELPYNININWSEDKANGCYDVIFKHQEAIFTHKPNNRIASYSFLKLWMIYANNPVSEKATSQLIPELRGFLKQKLADYMIPSNFVIMDSFPLTPNGKIDRRSLPAPTHNRPVLESPFVRPHNAIEEELAEIWSEVLEIKPVGIYDNFFELGGYSLLTALIFHQINEVFQLDVSLISFFDNPTISGLAETIKNLRHGNQKISKIVDLSAEVILDEAIKPSVNLIEPSVTPTNILLTGATGFLGAFLLQELLAQTEANIYCLVRAVNLQESQQKLAQNWQKYLIENENFTARVIPVLGNLSQPLLGLSESEFNNLATKIDVIYHNGAFVNLFYPYSALKATNVLGTQEILRLASKTKLKPVHYISTLAIFESDAYGGMKDIKENDPLEKNEGINDGYAQSKWVAKKLVKIASERGIPVSIYRPGQISGHSKTGVSNTNDLICRLFKAFVLLGNAPQMDWIMDLAPVDYVSSAIINLSRQKESIGKTFHLVNSQSLSLSDLIAEINSLGYSIKQIPYLDWQKEFQEVANHSADNSLSPLLPMVTEKIPGKEVTYLETSSMTSQSFDCANTLKGLEKTSLICPPVDQKLIATYFDYFNRSGFIVKQ